ncbi:uncharacterized protein LOC117150122 [Drosophila mauritiana]|uniref:Uncharacterized protein LOC117150122 n=1 Tax=Drosophila mauritiana TaxID=7226 RepID=A0A6P8LDZ5_DROMA|nr:uncharacterized protein LOC117150122 [Drosophila mauritiana]
MHLRLLCHCVQPAWPCSAASAGEPWQHTQQQLLLQQPPKHQQPASITAVSVIQYPRQKDGSIESLRSLRSHHRCKLPAVSCHCIFIELLALWWWRSSRGREVVSEDCSSVYHRGKPGAPRLVAIASGLAAWGRRFEICCRGPPQRDRHGNECKNSIWYFEWNLI